MANNTASSLASNPSLGPNPSGLCQCGCGQKTKISPYNFPSRGWVLGEPRRFLNGHHNRKSEALFIVNPDTGCWEWQRASDGLGYGQLNVDGKRYKAHRFFYEQKYGPIPEGLFLCHRCDNPACVNPDHMFVGTQKDNMRDAALKGRINSHSSHKTHCPQGHPYEGANLIMKNGRRVCRICKNEGLARTRARRKEKVAA